MGVDSTSREADAADQILKPRVASEGIESGIHPDPWHSSRPLEIALLKRLQCLLLFAEFGICGPG
jgi:hypothetical protein